MKSLILLLLFGLPLASVTEQDSIPSTRQDDQDALPSVFMIGEYEDDYEQIITGCNEMLLSACDDSMVEAYKRWLLMLQEMEDHADAVNFDIKGIKIWLNVFWNEDGSIQHIVYYPKPNSRNMDFSQLSDFFTSFVEGYDMSLDYSDCYSHFGSATFPSFAKIFLEKQEKDKKGK